MEFESNEIVGRPHQGAHVREPTLETHIQATRHFSYTVLCSQLTKPETTNSQNKYEYLIMNVHKGFMVTSSTQ